MVKKRGGRRGKHSEDQPSTQEGPPSTGQEPQASGTQPQPTTTQGSRRPTGEQVSTPSSQHQQRQQSEQAWVGPRGRELHPPGDETLRREEPRSPQTWKGGPQSGRSERQDGGGLSAGKGRGSHPPKDESPRQQAWGRGQQDTPFVPDGRGRGRGRGRGGGGRGRGRGEAVFRPGSDESWGRTQSPQQVGGAGEQQAWTGAKPKMRQEVPQTGWARQPFAGVGGGDSFEPQTPKDQAWGGAKPKRRPEGELLRTQQRSPMEKQTGSPVESKPEKKEEIHETLKTLEIKDPLPLPETHSLSEIEKLVPYPPGTRGRPIRIESNHVRLNLGRLSLAYRYDVSIEPEKKPKRMLRAAIKLFQQAYFPGNNPSYDGQKLLYSAKRLPLKDDIITGSVNLALEEGKSIEFKVTIKLTGTIDLSPLHDLLQKKNMKDAFQCVETVLRQAYTNSFINVGRRFYTKPKANEFLLGSGAQMYLGGYQAAVNGYVPLLNVDVAHKAFTLPTPIVEVIASMFSTRFKPLRVQDLKIFSLNRWQEEQINDYLKGLKIVYQIPGHPGSKKVYKINKLANLPNEEKFVHEGQTITVQQYFSGKWHCNLQFPNLPTLWVGNPDKRICLPLEYCTLQEGQPIEGSKLLGTQTAEMINFSATSTTDRKKKIENVMRTANHNENPCIREFGFSIGNQFEPLKGRVLNPPELEYSNDKVQPKNGVWWAKKFKKGAVISKWTVIGFGVVRERVNSGVNQLARMLIDYGASSGMHFEKPDPFDYIRGDQRSLVACLDKRKSFDLIIVVFQNKDLYHIIKQVAELNVGCLTQCIKTDTLNDRKLNESTVRNILLKINCKMNGTNHCIRGLGLITNEPCMVMGADVTHPSPHARTIPSVVAVTASHDLSATTYNICVYIQDPRTEIISNLKEITVKHLDMFFTNEKVLPKIIFFFRDGVSEGEFDKVREIEIKAIKEGCESFRKGYKPKITFLVVQKRHNTRFFPKDKESSGGDRFFNVPAGTCVDTVIIDPQIQNFYLCSHASIRGVARPTKYCTLYDDNNLTNDDVQLLAYSLCYLFTRCNRAVSYPAPTYFAHLAADRAKTYLYKKEINMDNLDQKLVKIHSGFAKRNPMFFS